ncbi:prepilin-type N-terminal cleavage/methylation domain-containing protein [Vibrio astriarenae]|jgi:MSHA pilin protein MshC
MKNKTGFTLVELILVIILIAIVSSYAASRYFGPSSFSAYTYQEAAVSLIRQIQVNRMHSNLSFDDLQCHEDKAAFSLNLLGNCFGSSASCSSVTGNNQRPSSYDLAKSDYIFEEDVNFTMTPTFSSCAELGIEFDLLGNPITSNDSGVLISINAKGSTAFVCINPQGYVSKGACL